MIHVGFLTPAWHPLTAPDTNNLLALLTRLYPDEEVLRKVVVIKHDHYTWCAALQLFTREADETGPSSRSKLSRTSIA